MGSLGSGVPTSISPLTSVAAHVQLAPWNNYT